MPLKDDRWPPTNDQVISSFSEIADGGRRSPEHHLSELPLEKHSTIQSQPQPQVTRPTLDSRVPSQLSSHTPSIVIPKYSLGIDSVIRQSIPRRAQITSQGTVVINKAARVARVKTIDHIASIIALDERKRQAEKEYYERRDSLGVLRRRSMMRTVSKEDYLLGRGANPRTGLITPGSGSIDSNFDSTELSAGEVLALPAKWKQKGDQWVSLDIDQPTPLTPPSPTLPSISQPPIPRSRLPRFANESKTRHETDTPENRRYAYYEMGHGKCKFDPHHVPGSYPESPTKPSDIRRAQSKPAISPVKRKPVGGSSSKPSSRVQTPSLKQRQGSVPYTPVHRSREANRSLSVPNLQKQSPVSVNSGNASLATFGSDGWTGPPAVHNNQGPRSFLGVRSQTLIGLHQLYKANQSVNLDKELPCLPTSSGPYQQLPSNQTLTPNTSPRRKEIHQAMDYVQQQPAQIVERAGITNRRSHVADMAISTKKVSPTQKLDTMLREGIHEVPEYDNPPQNTKSKPTRQQVHGPRAMPQPTYTKSQEMITNEAFLDPFSTTSMNTDTFMYAPNNRRLRSQPRFRYPPIARPPPCVPLPATPAPRHNRRDAVVMDALTVENALGKDSPPPPSLPQRSPERPLMPSRAGGLLQIPQAQRIQKNANVMHMEARDPLSTTGMHTLGNQKGDAFGIPQDENLAMEKDHTINVQITNIKPATSRILETSAISATRRCSRCQNGVVSDGPLSTGGPTGIKPPRIRSVDSAHAPEVISVVHLPTPITEGTELRSLQDFFASPPRSETSATILNVQDDLRDHSICCPDCCKLDCHEGCLGHSSPLPSPTRTSKQEQQICLHRIDSSSTLVSTSSESSASESKEDRKHKLSFLRNALKLTLWPKAASDDTQSNSRGSNKKQSPQLDSKSASSPKMILSKTIGGTASCGGATVAAKRAIASSSPNLSAENGLNQLMVSKRRSRAKQPCNLIVDEEKPATEFGLLSIPPTSKASATANERRKITGSRPCSESQSTASCQLPQTRNVSASSVDIHLPLINGVDLGELSELLFVVPVEAIRMWIHNNPQVLEYGWSALDCAQMMCFATLATTKVLMNTIYLYSKTGRLKIKDIHGNKMGVHEVMIDSLRSVLYVLILFGLTVVVWRILRFFLFPLRLLLLSGRYLISGSRNTAGR